MLTAPAFGRRETCFGDHPLRRVVLDQKRILLIRFVGKAAAAGLLPRQLFIKNKVSRPPLARRSAANAPAGPPPRTATRFIALARLFVGDRRMARRKRLWHRSDGTCAAVPMVLRPEERPFPVRALRRRPALSPPSRYPSAPEHSACPFPIPARCCLSLEDAPSPSLRCPGRLHW